MIRKNISILLLAVVSNVAIANWVQLGGSREVIAYADPATIRKSGDIAKMWTVLDFKKPQGAADNKFLSHKAQVEYNCTESDQRVIMLSVYSERMGGGNTIATIKGDGQWMPVAPETVHEALLKFACKKR